MIKALFLIFVPETAWKRVAESQRSMSSTVAFYLLPMILIVGGVEAYGLVKWGRWQSHFLGVKYFTPMEALISVAGQMALMALVIVVGGQCVKALGATFHGRHTYRQAFTVVIYGLSPIFLLRLLDAVPNINLWIPWAIGAALTAKILYHGVPCIMQPDPPQALGLYFMSVLLILMVSAMERVISIGYLEGQFKSVTDVISHIAAKLHL